MKFNIIVKSINKIEHTLNFENLTDDKVIYIDHSGLHRYNQ